MQVTRFIKNVVEQVYLFFSLLHIRFKSETIKCFEFKDDF